MTILTIVGARPQFIKAAPVSRALHGRHRQILLHTGQHYDDDMSGQFFRELGLPAPDLDLGVGSGTHGAQTAAMLAGIERAMIDWRPDAVIVYGDTNSTLAGALAASKLQIPIAHVEAGLRAFDRRLPEEVNRVVTDHLSSQLFCPSDQSAHNLAAEGITRGVHVVGDVMADQLAWAIGPAAASRVLETLGVRSGDYYLATVHRAGNVDDRRVLEGITRALDRLDARVVFPVHPRTRAALDAAEYRPRPHVCLIDPVGYLDMIRLQQGARAILTDSGGLQKEAYWLGVPCVTLRHETEWAETVAAGWNVLAGTDAGRIVDAVMTLAPAAGRPTLYGSEGAALRIVERLS
jgi:UDP-N-acetylglucosamine 2-epimerase